MKILTFLSLVVLSLSLLCTPVMSFANAAPNSSQTLTKKEYKQQLKKQKKQEKLQKRFAKVEKFIAKRVEKMKAKPQLDRPKWVYALIFFGLAVLLSLLAGIIAVGTVGTGIGISLILSVLATLSYIASLVFFVWWLVDILA